MVSSKTSLNLYPILTSGRLEDTTAENAPPPTLDALAGRTADKPVAPPAQLPATVPALKQHRFIESSVYPGLETNIHEKVLEFSQEPIPDIRSDISIQRHGKDTPFRPYRAIKTWVETMMEKNARQASVSYNTTVELVEKDATTNTWKVTLRKPIEGKDEDYWWTETFDAVVVANGHYFVPWIPSITGLEEFAATSPDAVIHSKAYRNKELYRGKRVVVVGASISGADLAFALAPIVAAPLTAVVRGKYNIFFGDHAFQHPAIVRRPTITKIETTGRKATVHFEDGTSLDGVNHIIFGTGYTWTLPFLPCVEVKNNHPVGLYQHVFWQNDPTLCFVGAVQAGFTFKIFEWQAVVTARYLSGRCVLPSVEKQIQWTEDRKQITGDGPGFAALFDNDPSNVVDHFEDLRRLAGEPSKLANGRVVGRSLPPFSPDWMRAYYEGHNMRIQMWKNGNEAARKELVAKSVPPAAEYNEKVADEMIVEVPAIERLD